jgi:hypothetical protein
MDRTKPLNLEDVGAAYLDLLQIPIASGARQNAGKAMILLRDHIAERLGRSSESVQTSFEEQAADMQITHPFDAEPSRPTKAHVMKREAMDKIKRDALELATRSFHGRPAYEIVQAAEVFERYLSGEVRQSVSPVTGIADVTPLNPIAHTADGTMIEVSPEEMARMLGKHMVEPGALFHGDIKP